MSRRQIDPLRPLTAEERGWLARISLSDSQPAAPVARATMLLAVAAGQSYTGAAQVAGRRSGEAGAHLVSRFNHDGGAAVEPRHGGGPPTVYTSAERDRILAEARRPPDPVRDGTATWSLTTLQRALRRAPVGGVGRGRSRSLSDDPLPGAAVVPGRAPGPLPARARAQRHGQAADAVPSGQRGGARQGGHILQQCRASWLATDGIDYDPGDAAHPAGAGQRSGEPSELGALAGGPGGAPHAEGRVAAAADAAGSG